MADFARWVQAAETNLPLEPGQFMQAYLANRSGAVQLTLESSPLTEPVITIAGTGFEGTATELLDQLNALVIEEVRKQRGWPKQPHTLAGRIRRLAPALRRLGVSIEFDRSGHDRTRMIRVRQLLEQTGNQASGASASVRNGSEASDLRTLADAADALFPTSSSERAS
jgi:hypothetical protein